MSTQGLLERPNGYYFQARIPKQYLKHYPKTVIREKLPTDNRKEAIALVRKRWAKLQEEFERIDSTNTKAKTSITPSEADYIIQLAIHTRLSADSEIRSLGVDDDTFQRLEDYYTENDNTERLAVSRGLLTPYAIEIVSDWLRGHNYEIEPDSITFREFALKFITARIAATEAIRLRQQGIPSETPPAPSKQSKGNDDWDSLEKLRDYWITQGEKSRTAKSEADTMIKKFRKFVGDLKPSEIKREHVVLLKDKMREAGSAPATINKGRGILAAIFSTAEKNVKITNNPFRDMEKLPIPESEDDSPYTISELQTIFNSKVFTQGFRPKRFNGESSYWLPLLGLYTACRLNEVGQLYTEDIKEEDGIPYLLIKPDTATGRTVKDGKKRRVPLHPALIKMGFMDYVTTIKSQGHQQLFPELNPTRDEGKLADKWGAWWSEYVRKELLILRIPKPYHGFRHTFSDHCRRCNVGYEAHMRIEGHSMNNVGDKYGNKLFPLEPLYEEISKLTFKGLDLSHLIK